MIFIVEHYRTCPRGLAGFAIDNCLQDQSIAFVDAGRPYYPTMDMVGAGTRQFRRLVNDAPQQISAAQVAYRLKKHGRDKGLKLWKIDLWLWHLGLQWVWPSLRLRASRNALVVSIEKPA
jgi:hypothetical protein